MIEDLYTEDEIVDLENDIKSIKDLLLLDDHNDLYSVVDYHIESITVNKLSWLRWKPSTLFHIKSITIMSKDEVYCYTDDYMCTSQGIDSLMKYRQNYLKFEKNFNKFAIKNDKHVTFGNLKIV